MNCEVCGSELRELTWWVHCPIHGYLEPVTQEPADEVESEFIKILRNYDLE